MSAPSQPTTSTTKLPDGGSTGQTQTEVLPPTTTTQPETPTVRIALHQPSTNRRVSWNATTIDNEHLNKKKSKCCCIYKKPRNFGESSSESDDDECDNCFGHVEGKKHKKKAPYRDEVEHPYHDHPPPRDSDNDDTDPPSPTSPAPQSQPV